MKRERGPAAASHRAFGKKHAREVDQQRPRCGWARNARRMPRTTKPGGGIGGPMELLGRFCALRGDQGFFMQDPNLSQVSLRFFNAVPYGVQLFLERHLASMIQRGFKALDAKCRTSGKGISLLCSVAGRHGSILEFAGT